jgi:hypothetical protein
MAEEKREKYRWIDAITKLIELTQTGKLVWTRATDEYIPKHRKLTTVVFIANYNDKLLRLYGAEPYAQHWNTEDVILEFITPDGNTLWQFPETSAINSLLYAVQYRFAGVNEFLNEILEERVAS